MARHTNNDYDIGKAFTSIEDELIASMIRNMKRHKLEEIKEDKQWSMWQAEQLKSLEKYKKANRKKYGKQFRDINGQIEQLIRIANSDGQMSQEKAILNAIKKGFPARKAAAGATAEFFRLNDRKLEALIKATTNDMQSAETAVLRMANDQYRKIIYNAQVYANTGAGTYEKAVDMASRDFLSAGLNCVEYKNGARHTLANYARMAIRTASKRAYLQGEGTKRQEWGIHTVIVNKRGNPCPLCLPFCGKVLIDDVWSGGSRKDGKYPLMSSAVSAGLYHPNCKDSHTTYFEGISTPPDDTYTRKEVDEIAKQAKQEAKEQHAKRQEERFGRMAKYSLDPENKELYARKEKHWKELASVDIHAMNKSIKSPIIRNETAAIDYRTGQKVIFKDLSQWNKSFGKATPEEYDVMRGYIKNTDSFGINSAMREGNVSKLSENKRKVIDTLESVIDRNTSDRNAVLMRKLDLDYIDSVFGIKGKDPAEIVKELNEKKVGGTFLEKGFTSASYKSDHSVLTTTDIEMEIYAPEGTKMFLTKNRDESEIILQSNTLFELEGAELMESGTVKLVVKVDKQLPIGEREFSPRKSVAKAKDSGIIKMYRKGSTHRKISESGHQIIDKATYHKIVNPAIKQGADIRIADDEWNKRLIEKNATAVTIGDVIYFRPDATVSDVLEEVHHFRQNKNGMNSQYGNRQRMIMNEIDAKEYLLAMTEKYNIPKEEVTLTKRQLESYKQEMEELRKEGVWID